MSERYNIDFEPGDFSEWDSSGGTNLVVSSSSPITGTWSARADWVATPVSVDNSLSLLSTLGDTFRIGMRVRLNSLNYGSVQTTSDTFFAITSGTGDIVRLRFLKSGSQSLLEMKDSISATPIVGSVDFSDGVARTIEARIVKESSFGAGDGVLELFIEGLSEGSDTGVTNFNQFNSAKVGLTNFLLIPFDIISGTGHSGSGSFDDLIFRDDDTQIYAPPATTHIWLSTDGAATFANIGDSAWTTEVVGGVVVVPGTAYQTIFATVDTDLYKTVDGGTTWTLETAIGYEIDFLDLEKDNTTVFMAKRDAAGTNRASLWDGITLSHLNTGKSTTGGATAGGDVV